VFGAKAFIKRAKDHNRSTFLLSSLSTSMIYLIYGPDSFRSNQYLNYLKDFYHNKNPFYFSFDFADKFETALEPDIN